MFNYFDFVRENYSILGVAKKLGIKLHSSSCKCLMSENHAKNDKTPSMSFDLEHNRFKCFVCTNFKGSNIDLFLHYHKLENNRFNRHKALEFITELPLSDIRNKFKLTDAARLAADGVILPTCRKLSLKIETDSNNNNSNSVLNRSIYLDFLDLLDTEDALQYLCNDRCISSKVVEKFNIRSVPRSYNRQKYITTMLRTKYSATDLLSSGLYSPKSSEFSVFKHYRLVIPIYRNGAIVSMTARSIDNDLTKQRDRYTNLHQHPIEVFNLDSIYTPSKEKRNIVIVEGILNALSWYTLDIPNTDIIALNGTSNISKLLNPQTLDSLKLCNVKANGDNDQAGRDFNDTLSDLLFDYGIGVSYFDFNTFSNILGIPSNDYNDMNEMLKVSVQQMQQTDIQDLKLRT